MALGVEEKCSSFLGARAAQVGFWFALTITTGKNIFRKPIMKNRLVHMEGKRQRPRIRKMSELACIEPVETLVLSLSKYQFSGMITKVCLNRMIVTLTVAREDRQVG